MECRLVNIASGLDDMYPLREGETIVGRESDNHIQLLNEHVSRHHAKITNMPSICQVEDLGSANGTFIGGEKVDSAILKDGDEIRFADEVFRFETKGSVGSDEVLTAQRDYSGRVQKNTVKLQHHVPETKVFKAVTNLPPLRQKK